MNAKQRRKWKRKHREVCPVCKDKINKMVQFIKDPKKLGGDKDITKDGYLLVFNKEMSQVDCVVFLQNHGIDYKKSV